MDYKILKYDDLVNNPQDFTIKVMCVKHTFNNEIAQLIDMFSFMNKYCINSTFNTKHCDDISGQFCTCVGYIKASELLANYVDISFDAINLRPIFYLWQTPYNETTTELKDIVLNIGEVNKNNIILLKQIRDILLATEK